MDSYTYRETSCRREAATICPAPLTLTFDLLTLKVVYESRVTWATSVPNLVFLDYLDPMYATDVRQTYVRQTDRQTDVRQHHHLMPPPRGRGIIRTVLFSVLIDNWKYTQMSHQCGLLLVPQLTLTLPIS